MNFAAGQVCEIAHSEGYFRIDHPLFPASRCTEALTLAREFFALPAAEKELLAIERSPHFRGYSVMHNPRDWREQIHFGREEAPRRGAVYERLRGPNLWPRDDLWRRRMLALFDDLEVAGRDILGTLAEGLGLGRAGFLADGEVPYSLLKLIHYQPVDGAAPRPGVAPHVDFSWITLLLQDDAGGLELRGSDGLWHSVPAVPGTLLVNVGEVLQFASGGYFSAAPHRVISRGRSRVSLPFFLNPGLDTPVQRVPVPCERDTVSTSEEWEHVHRVFCEVRRDGFVFGEQEWRRKGLGVYCGRCCIV